MKGKVVNFRRSLKHIHERHFLIDAGCTNRKEALELTGKEVTWKSPANKIIPGKISSAHGNKGLVRAIFERGLPGQAINTEVEITGEDKPKIKKQTKKKE
jgi:large subunit ribosomal protein L35Ae